jgi:TonB family protein
MFDLDTSVKSNRRPSVGPVSRSPQEPKQRRMMVVALTLLLVSLGFVLYRDRDFWFPDTQESEAQSQPEPAAPSTATPSPTLDARSSSSAHKKSYSAKSLKAATRSFAAPSNNSRASATVPPVSVTRTILPPLEVEVVAGDVHNTLRPGTNSVHVDLQPSAPAQEAPQPPAPSGAPDTAAGVTTNAAEHVQISADTAEVVSRPVKPGYPLLARQMKVQGSVILQALIGRDGLIQDLHVLSGPPILANAAQEAVKQWHFKPHYEGADAVETQAKITVNFTISTN